MSKTKWYGQNYSAFAGLAMADSCDGYRIGYAVTTSGVVGIYEGQLQPYTELRVVHYGRTYSRSIERTFTDRGLLTIAGRFAREIAGQANS